MTTATAKLTRHEAAYAHLASFRLGDEVHVGGRAFDLSGTVTLPQQHDHADISRSYLIVASPSGETRVTVGLLACGQAALAVTRAAPPCHICGKTPGDPHSSATRTAHSDHQIRLGWSGMCPAPRTVRAEDIKPGQAIIIRRRPHTVVSIDDHGQPLAFDSVVTDPEGARHTLGIWRGMDYQALEG
jgi:hypothetical protein